MSFEAALKGVLELECPDVFPDTAPFGTAGEYVIYQQIGGPEPSYVEGGGPGEISAYVQIDVWADTRLGANALMRAIAARLGAATVLTAKPQGGLRAMADEVTGRRGASQDFEVWAPAGT